MGLGIGLWFQGSGIDRAGMNEIRYAHYSPAGSGTPSRCKDNSPMKRALAIWMVSVVLAVTARAADDKPLGAVHFALKADYLAFTDTNLKYAKVDTGVLGGAELYVGLVEGLYIGAESGYAQNKGSITILNFPVDNKLTYVPVELNAKYVFALAPWLTLDVGAGGCYNYARFEVVMDNISEPGSEWIPGGQGFADLNFIAGPLFIGVDAKYQMLRKFKDVDLNLNNWQLGAHLGLAF